MSMNRGNDEVRIPIAKPSPVLSPLIPARKVSPLLQRVLAEDVPQPIFPLCSSLQQAAEIYHREYARLLAQNQETNRNLAAVIAERNNLADRYNHLKRAKGSQEYVKRRRREAKDIAREFFCPMQKCRKGYGSEGSLTHHVRLKHKEYFDSGRYELFLQQYLQQLAQGKQRGAKEGDRQEFNKEVVLKKEEPMMKEEHTPPQEHLQPKRESRRKAKK